MVFSENFMGLKKEYVEFSIDRINKHSKPRALKCAIILLLAREAASNSESFPRPKGFSVDEAFHMVIEKILAPIYYPDVKDFNIAIETMMHLVPEGIDEMMQEADRFMGETIDLWDKKKSNSQALN